VTSSEGSRWTSAKGASTSRHGTAGGSRRVISEETMVSRQGGDSWGITEEGERALRSSALGAVEKGGKKTNAGGK